MKKVLLTGASGFIGRHCIPLLISHGYEVHAITSKEVPPNQPSVKWHSLNLLETKAVDSFMAEVKPTHLLHLAWDVMPGKYLTASENLPWVQASLNLILNFQQQGGQRVVIAGTCFEYDWQYGYCKESITPLVPNTFYGTCKHSLQTILAAFAQQTQLSSAWGRIFFLYGPHEYPQRLVSSVINALLKNQPAKCSHGNQIRDFLHVQDVASAFVALLDSEITGAVNIASGIPVTLKSVIFEIANLIGNPELVQLGAISSPPNEPHLLVGDIGRLENEIKWQPKYSLSQGLQHTISWWKSENIHA